MPNANYQRGVRFERERQHYYTEVLKQICLRTAGSHGLFDLISVDSSRSVVTLIQCKVTASAKQAERLLRGFRENPPLSPMTNIHQTMEVKVSGSTEVLSVTV